MNKEEQMIILKTINKLDKKVTSFERDTRIDYIKYDWIIKRQHIVETIHIQSAITKIMKYLFEISKDNKEIPLYNKAKNLYDRCDKLLNVLDPQ